MHELVGKAARVREEKQALGIDVETADRLPLALLQPRQAPEHRRPVLRIVVGDDLAGRLVVGDDARRRRHDAHAHRLAVDLDPVAERDALSGVRRLAVDRDAAFDDQVFHVAARADAGLRQHLVQLGSVGLGCQHALVRRVLDFRDCFRLGVELARQDMREDLAGLGNRPRLKVQGQRPFEVRRQWQRRPAWYAVAAPLAAAPVASATAAAAIAARRIAFGRCRLAAGREP